MWMIPGGPGFLAVLHQRGLLSPHELWSAWGWEPLPAVGMAVLAILYIGGARRLWREAGPGRGLHGRQVVCFLAGLGVLALALFSPLDALGETLFAAHMVQHLLLLVVAAPLLAASAPPTAMLWALPVAARRSLARWWNRRSVLRAVAELALAPASAWILSVGAMVLWHLPALYQSALASEAVHGVEHLSFLGGGFLFWWAALRPDAHRRLNYGASVLYVFTAGLPAGLLGALLTFAGQPLYPGQSAAAPLWGMTPLDDQQLAGLIMWMPGGLVYLAIAGVFFVAWLHTEERRGLRETMLGGTIAGLFLVVLLPGYRPKSRPLMGEDSTQTAAAPSAPLDSSSAGRAEPASGFTRVAAVVGLSGPESVRYDPAQDLYFISNFQGTLTAEANNDFIRPVRADGLIDSLKFITGGRNGVVLNAPIGMTIRGDTLWVADVTTVRGFNSRTGAPVATVHLSRLHPRLLNDLGVGPGHALYVTDTGIRLGPDGAIEHSGPDRIFRIRPNGRTSAAAQEVDTRRHRLAVPVSSENRGELWSIPAGS